MWMPSDFKLLDSNGDDHKFSLLLIQAWHELLSPSTPDTYRARALDLFSLLDELDQVALIAIDDERWKAHVKAVGEELSDSIEEEARLLQGNPLLRSQLQSIASDATQCLSISLLREKLRVVRSHVGNGVSLLIDDMSELVSAGPKFKSELLSRLATLATHVEQRGLAEESLAGLKDEMHRYSPSELIEALTQSLVSESRSFDCFVRINGHQGDSLSILDDSPFARATRRDYRPDAETGLWRSRLGNDLAVRTEIRGLSGRLAAESALARLSSILNMHNLYCNSAAFHADPKVLVYGEHNTQVIEVTPSKHFGLKPRKQARKRTRSGYSRIGERIDGRLSNILESHKLGLSSQEPRSAIINLWTALEAIAGPNGLSNTGERVAAVIAPIVAWRRVDKIATYMAIECLQAMKRCRIEIDTRVLCHSAKSEVSPADLMLALTGPKNNERIAYLLRELAASPLLINRLFEEWKNFSVPSVLAKTLVRSKKRVRWQVLRLYRARNLLVHKGEMSPIVWRLLQNAQYYVSTAVGRILYDLSGNPDWSIDTSLSSQSMRFDYVCNQLTREGGKNLTVQSFLATKVVKGDVALWAEHEVPLAQPAR